MPTVPQLSTPQISQAPLSIAGRQPAPSLSGIAGQALSGFAEVQQKLAMNKRTLQATSLLADASKKLEEFQLGLETDRDYETQHQRYEQLVQTINSDVQKGGDPQISRLFTAEFAPLAARKGFEVQRGALKGQISLQRATVDQNLESLAGLAGGGDPEYDAYLIDRGENMLADAYEIGILSNAEELQSKASTFRSDVVVAGVRRQIMEAPELAESQLLGDGFPGLTGDDRTVWTERAQAAADSIRRERVANDERRYRLAERAERDSALVAERDGLELQRSGSLSPEWIETNRDVLTPEAQRYFYRAMNGEDAVTDFRTYTDLRERAGNGEDVTDLARSALFSNAIKREDYDRVLGVIDSRGRTGWYKRGEEYITRFLRPSDTNPDPAAPQRWARAMDDWYQWGQDHKDATESDAVRAFNQITTDYKLVDANLVMVDGARPRYLVGGRTEPDLDATELATVEAFDRGEISEDEFNKQSVLLKEWRRAVEDLKRLQGTTNGSN